MLNVSGIQLTLITLPDPLNTFQFHCAVEWELNLHLKFTNGLQVREQGHDL